MIQGRLARRATPAILLMVMLQGLVLQAQIQLTPMPLEQWENIPESVASYSPAHIKQPPEIDGKLDDLAWQEATVINQFAHRDGLPEDAQHWAKVRLVRDDDALYASGQMHIPGRAIQTRIEADYGPVWRDHSIELFLFRPDTGVRYHIVVNAKGAFWAGTDRRQGQWRPAIKAAATIDQDLWRFEFKLPWADLGFNTSPVQSLRMQLRYLQPNSAGLTAWVASHAGADDGLLVLGTSSNKPLIQVRRFLFPRVMSAGKNHLGIEVQNTADKPRRVVARVMDLTAKLPVVSQTLTDLQPGEVREFMLPIQFDGSNGINRMLAVRDTNEPERWLLDVRREIRPLSPLQVRLDRERVWYGDDVLTGHIEAGVEASALSTAELHVELWDDVHRLQQTTTSLQNGQRFGLRIDLKNLKAGNYRLVVKVQGVAQLQQQTIAVKVGQVMALPDLQRVALQVDWPEGSTYAGRTPLYAGLSFPAGTLKDPAHVRLVDGSGVELPLQTQVLATWGPGGTIKWLGLYFIGRQGESYAAEFGRTVERRADDGPQVRVEEKENQYIIDTGTARFELPKIGPLLGRAWLNDVQVLQGGQGVLLVADQNGKVADETAGGMDEAPTIEMAGPLQVIVRREGLLRTADGKRLGKYVVRMTFAAGVSWVPVQHSFVVTEDTNQVQFRDVAFRVKPVWQGPWSVALDTSPAAFDGKKHTLSINTQANEGAYLLQAVYPHHRQKVSRAMVGVRRDGQWQTAQETEVAGQWLAAWSNGSGSGSESGVALTRRHMAFMFPSELEVGSAGLTAHLWSSRDGRLLDYRAPAIVEHVGREWVDKEYPGGVKALSSVYTNGVSSARTNELCLHLFAPANDLNEVEQVAWLTENPAMTIQDPAWLAATQAMGPVHPYDPEHFPRIEAFAEQFFKQCIQGQVERFGDYGFLDYGAGPHYYSDYRDHPGDSWPRLNYRYSDTDYQLRTTIWLAYARSGKRSYLDYGQALNGHINDFKFSHFDAPGKPLGVLLGGYGSEEFNLYWKGIIGRFPAGVMSGHQGFDLENYFNQFFLTGDRRGMDSVHEFAQRFISDFDPAVLPNVGALSSNSVPYGFAALLYGLTWDTRFADLLDACRQRLLDVRTTTGLAHQDYYGAMHKPEVRMWGAVKDYQVTGSHTAGQAILRLAEHRLRSTPPSDAGYHEHSGILFYIANELTGDSRFVDWMATRLSRLAYRYTTPDGALQGQPYEQGSHTVNIIETVDYGLSLLANAPQPPRLRPIFAPTVLSPSIHYYMVKPIGQPVQLEVRAGREMDVVLAQLAAPDRAHWRQGYTSPIEVQWHPRYFNDIVGLDAGHAYIQLPPDAMGGIYRLDNMESLIACDAKQLVLAAPQGVWLDGTLLDAPPYWFCIPANLSGEIFVSKPARLMIAQQNVELQPGKWTALPSSTKQQFVALHVDGLNYVRLRGDIPAVFARSEQAWFLPPGKQTPITLPSEVAKGSFGPGVSGMASDQALLLSGNQQLSVPLGDKVAEQAYAQFDARRGTLEFWLRPRWSAPMQTEPKDRILLSNPNWFLAYRTRQNDHLDNPYSGSNFWFVVKPDSQKIHHEMVNRVSIWQNHWSHVALVWDTDPQEGWVTELYVDGKPSLSWGRKGVGMSRFMAGQGAQQAQWHPALPGLSLQFMSQFDGWIDGLRISDMPRYTKSFTPRLVDTVQVDEHTLLTIDFDGKDTPTIHGTVKAKE